jgi:hypothetical protein
MNMKAVRKYEQMLKKEMENLIKKITGSMNSIMKFCNFYCKY